MAGKNSGGVQRIVDGAALPSDSGSIDLRKQGFTKGSYGAETMADRLATSPPVEETLL